MSSDLSRSGSAGEADLAIIAGTRSWLERAVIGLNLCPFTRAPYIQNRVRLRISHAGDHEALLDDLGDELRHLHAADPADCETTLLIVADLLHDFLDFNDFLDAADAAVLALGLEGELQVASFHPEYTFADSAPGDIANYTNRAPYPILHLLREASVERAVEAVEDPDEIYRRNIETLERLGRQGWDALWDDPPPHR